MSYVQTKYLQIVVFVITLNKYLTYLLLNKQTFDFICTANFKMKGLKY